MSIPTSSTPLVSFAVTAYNTEKYIAECLDSIFAQLGDYDYEVIVVDDASTDNTEQVVRTYTDSRLRYIRHSSNQGAFETVNRGFREARGKFVARIDSDDRYRPDFLLTVVPVLERYPEVGLVYGDIALINSAGDITSASDNVNRHGLPQMGNELIPLLEVNYLPAPTTIARREAWALGLPVPRGLDFCDWYLSTTIAKAWDFYYCTKVLADYRIHSQNHHVAVVLDKSGERVIRQVLDQVFGEPERKSEKKRAKARIYSRNYITLADKYFGHFMLSDARRCYLLAIWYRPLLLLRLDILRRTFGTFLGMGKYEKLKLLVKSVVNKYQFS